MIMKKKYVSVLLAGLVAMSGMAQEQLHKEITLDKDFVPVEKKADKKSALPKVFKPAKSGKATSPLSYSDWSQPVALKASIPTMLPYGYRTSHLFSKQRGYLDLGAGTQLNFVASAGYRIVDEENLRISGWLQHNSTWVGKNSSTVIVDDNERLKQKFNDNVLGLDLHNVHENGTLDFGVKFHFDKFNYYGGAGQWWNDNKQTFVDALVKAGWKGKTSISENDVDYHAQLLYNYAGYDKAFSEAYHGAKEHNVKLNIGADYALSETSGLGGTAALDYINRSYRSVLDEKVSENMTTVTLSPFYRFLGEKLSARLGANVNFSFGDGAAIRLSPNVRLDYEIAPGFSFYANALGGKRFNTMASMAALSRYSDPLARYSNSFSPIDAEAGLNIGPFRGFKLKVFGGYGRFKREQVAYIPGKIFVPSGGFKHAIDITSQNIYAPVFYMSINTDGFKAGAELEYRYRSVFQINVGGGYAPHDDQIAAGKNFSGGYTLGLDRPAYVLTADIKVYPVRALTLNVGFEFRGKRQQLIEYGAPARTGNEIVGYDPTYDILKLNDVANLKAGAGYRFDKTLTLWLQANNLLNRRWDTLTGMGAQRFGFMGGLALTF